MPRRGRRELSSPCLEKVILETSPEINKISPFRVSEVCVKGAGCLTPKGLWICHRTAVQKANVSRVMTRVYEPVPQAELEPTTLSLLVRRINVSQYFGTLGSTLSLHARIPPLILRTFLNPACFRKSTAFALRIPLLQCATISSAVSSSFTRFGNSPSGISF